MIVLHDVLSRLDIWVSEWKEILQFLLFTSSVILLYTAPIVVSMIYYFINAKIRKRDVKKAKYLFFSNPKINAIIVILFIVGSINVPFDFFNCGNTDINSCFEKNYYTEEYYVYLANKRNDVKRYKLRATIKKTSSSITEEHYFVKQVYWENGGYLTFSSSDKIGEEITPNIETACTDYNDNQYYITLTTEKVN